MNYFVLRYYSVVLPLFIQRYFEYKFFFLKKKHCLCHYSRCTNLVEIWGLENWKQFLHCQKTILLSWAMHLNFFLEQIKIFKNTYTPPVIFHWWKPNQGSWWKNAAILLHWIYSSYTSPDIYVIVLYRHLKFRGKWEGKYPRANI